MIKQYISKDDYKQIVSYIDDFNRDKNFELEASFRVNSYGDFEKIVEHFVNTTNANDISSLTSLDILVGLANGPEKGNTYRVSILDDTEINNFTNTYLRKSISDIQSYLLNVKKSDMYEILVKENKTARRLMITELNFLVKISTETEANAKVIKGNLSGTEKMLFRYKERYSFVQGNIRYDLTIVQQSSELWNLAKANKVYEIEMEIVNKIKPDDFFEAITQMLKLTQKTTYPISNSEATSVVTKYTQLLDLSRTEHLDVRNVVSLETQHLKFIPNKYAVTEKADGDRCCLFIIDTGVYLLTTNLEVKKTSLVVTDKKYHNTLLDGELIVLDNKSLFMAFDVVYHNSIDFRTNTKYILVKRLDILNDIIDKCFGNLIEFNTYIDNNSNVEYDKIRVWYQTEIPKYWKKFNAVVNKSKQELFITRKISFVPYGVHPSELFMYADLLWKNLFYNSLAPYKLDGIIYTPLDTPYFIKVSIDLIDTLPMEYKWKTSNHNSIDYFIKFEKNSNGEDIVYYDDTTNKSELASYKVCGLYVGIKKGRYESPVPFKVNGIEQKANIYLTNGEPLDAEGNTINDCTVVEFVFDITKPEIDNAYKWIALRTRHDKTESVRKYRKKYGNSLAIANRIWRTIINPITEESISTLANPETYEKEIKRLLTSDNTYVKKPFVYYQKETAEAKPMRAFNNWIKTNMISTYCRNKPSILDIGCGRGGDLLKFINAGVGEYVGLDIDRAGLYQIKGSAVSRYKNHKSKLPNVPPMYFIHADARAKFNVTDQESVIQGMNDYNKQLIDKHLSGKKKYSVINAQFTIHYYMGDDISWGNFCKNINDHLEYGGHVLITGFDGKLIYDNLLKRQKMTVSYTDDTGKKVVFFEITKAYSNSAEQGLGMAIDLYNSLYSEPDTPPLREYLIFPDFLIKSFKDKCGLELVETDTFYNLFNLYKEYFTNSNPDDVQSARYQSIRTFYTSLEPNGNSDISSDAALSSFKLSMLNRYYVFKKSTKNSINSQARVYGVNHRINLGNMITPYFITNNMIIKPETKSRSINETYKQICKKYPSVKPNVYIVRHTCPVEELDADTYAHNKFDFVCAKQTDHDKVLLIYKSPEKDYYPIYFKYRDNEIYDIDDIDSNSASEGTYMLQSSKILNDLEMLVHLTNNQK